MEIKQPTSVKHYEFSHYCRNRFSSYWNQCDEVLSKKTVKTVLVVGQGDNIVPMILRLQGMEVDTFDIIEDMEPTYQGDVREITNIVHMQYDCILCCEVLEHLPFSEFEPVVLQFKQLAKKNIIISLPMYGIAGYVKVRLPKLNFILNINVNVFGKRYRCNEHFWEIGMRETRKRDINRILARNKLSVEKQYVLKEEPRHAFWVIKV